MNSKSFSVMTGPTSFLLQAKIIWPAVLSDSCWFYDFDNASFQNFKKKFGFFFEISFQNIMPLSLY